MKAVWKPHVTVAAVIEDAGRFLLVEEETESGIRLNQPAGHLEANESLLQASVRETLEETRCDFVPEFLIGVYRWTAGDTPYLRFAFAGQVSRLNADYPLDHGIIRALWLTAEELRACTEMHRSPLVMRCVEDYLAGRRMPLDFLVHYG
jgi:ADP-ribose pyrophosphatase YjhB (NUDIX family)